MPTSAKMRISDDLVAESGERTESLPVERNELHPCRPHVVRSEVAARQATSTRIRARQVSSVVGDKVLPSRLVAQHLGEPAFAERDDMRRRVLLLLVEATRFDADRVDEEVSESLRHRNVFRLCRQGGRRQ